MSEDIKRGIDSIDVKISDFNSRISSLGGQCELLGKQISENELRIEEIKLKKELFAKAAEVLDLAQASVRMNIKVGFETIVTYALQYILGTDYMFELDFGRRGKLQEVNLNVKTPTLTEAFDPLDTSGGGTIDIIALALRVAMLELHKPVIAGPIILDESFKHLSRQHLNKAGSFLNALSERIGRQVIMISHKSELMNQVDKTIEVK